MIIAERFEPAEERVSATPEASFAPLSYAQQRLWLLHRLQPASTAYNVRKAFRIDGALDVPSLHATLNAIVRRHEIFRTTFVVVEGEPVQSIAPTLGIPLPMHDLSEMPASEREPEAYRRVHAEAARVFDLASGPLVRAALFRLQPEQHILLLVMHHIVFDDGSVGAFNREFSELYNAHLAGVPSGLEELPIQYADFAVWQREVLQGEALATDLRYWREQLAQAPASLDVPADFPRPPVQQFKGSTASIVLPRELADDITALTRAHGTTLFMTLLAAFNVLLYRYTGQRDLVVGSPIANRTRTELESLIGFFVNTLALRTRLTGEMRFDELLERVRETAIGAYEHQDLPFERVVEQLQPDRNLGSLPLVNVMFFVRSALGEPLQLAGLRLSPYPLASSSARFDLTLRVSEVAAGLECSLQYDTELFGRERVERMLAHFENLLRGIVAAPRSSLRALPMLSPAERQRLLVEWNATDAPYASDRPLHRVFEERAARTADAVAVRDGNVELTYRELNMRANRLARTLRKQGIGRGSVVGVCTERNHGAIVAVLAVNKAGGAYLPLDPHSPPKRLQFMLANAGASLILTQREFLGRLGRYGGVALIDIDAVREEAGDDVSSACGIDDPAYVMYTSGSTGRPKGVTVPQRAVCRLVTGTNYVTIGVADTLAQVASLSFDAATFEIWGALLNGARLDIVPRGVSLAPAEFERYLKERRISIMFLTAALFRFIGAQKPAAFEHLACLIVGGETVDPGSVRAVLNAGPPLRLLNGYGPTEVTTFACTYEITAPPTGPVPIGRPIANTEAYILDADLNLVPAGVRGQLYLGGPGLARYYVRDAESTARKFIPHPFGNAPGARLYATGDLARYLPSGDIDFLGRSDRQVKIRGFRIETGEIEAALRALPSVRDAAVCVREDAAGDKRLVAYVVTNAPPARTSDAWRRLLAEALPEYMLPSAVVAVPSIALTSNGKVDFAALSHASAPSTPRTEAVLGDPAHYQLVGLWADLLGAPQVGLRDSFFDLGGHSLLTMRMLAEVETLFGRSVSLAAFLEDPTIAHLATLLAQGGGANVAPPIVELRSAGSQTPFFFFHGDLQGGGYYTRRLGRLLGEQRPFYVLSPQGVGAKPLPATVEQIARDYFGLIKKIQPSGPYLVGGFCSGGLVALELARLLQARGEYVSDVLLLDSPGSNGRLARMIAPLDRIAALLRIGRAGRIALSGQVGVLAHNVHRALQFASRTRAGSRSGKTHDALQAVLGRALRACVERRDSSLEGAWRRLTMRYVARPYRGRVTLLLPVMEPTDRSRSQQGWRSVAPELSVATVPGEHLTCVTHYLDETAVRIREALDHADDRRAV